MSESDYVKKYCKGTIEHRLYDSTRVDCLTDDYAIEYDWGHKWAEGIGQALFYGAVTGKKPAVALIVDTETEKRYIDRALIASKGVVKIIIIEKE
jgi:hypothetical protein